ncbi:MAG: methyl-accepting chemotaxis protein [Gammaproteobacteria bacterium]|nr:methyl-accepting chemotaxis protein [Gammaproteobacteria bacterium]
MRLRTRIVLVVTVCITVIASSFMLASWRTRQVTEQRFAQAMLDAKSALWRNVVASENERMSGALRALTRASKMLEALSSGRHELLEDELRPTYNRLSASDVLTDLRIVDTRLRLAYAATPTDDDPGLPLDDPLLQEAATSNKILRGLVFDRQQGLVAELVFPLYKRGSLVGYGIFRKSLANAIGRFADSDGSQAALLFDSGETMVTSSGYALPVTGVAEMLRARQGGLQIVKEESTTLALSLTPLADAAGSVQSWLVTAEDFSASFDSQARIDREAYLTAGFTTLVALLGLAWYLNRAFRPLGKVLGSMRAIADGDLSVTLEASGRDEFGTLVRETQRMRGALQGKLRSVLDSVNRSLSGLMDAVHNLGGITDAASEGAHRQQLRTRQLADRLTQMLGSVRETAQAAEQAATQAQQAQKQAAHGGQVAAGSLEQVRELTDDFQRVAAALDTLERAGREIGKLTDAIDEIAAQTNVLALNASIEASRAGEQGKGFSIVAEQVRELAQGTREANIRTREIVQVLSDGVSDAVNLIDHSKERVDATLRCTDEVAQALHAISERVDSIARINALVSDAANAQRLAADDIERGIGEISEVAEQAAEGARRTAGASESLTRLTEQMDGLLRDFRLGDHDPPKPAT